MENEKNEVGEKVPEITVKEDRIRKIAPLYYSRSDIRKAIFEFSKNRECVPRYFEGFGRRPDSFQFDSDIPSLVQKGATSFHCSEELWKEPLDIATGMSGSELDNLRIGWDLLIDIDCKYIEYSKKAAYSIIMALKSCGIENIGLKFSVTGDTPILTKQGTNIALKPIKGAIEDFKKFKNLEVLSIDKNKKLKFSKVYDSLEHKDKIYELTHENSKIPVKTTAHHSVFIFDRGNLIQKKVSELKKGEFLVTFNAKNTVLGEKISSFKNTFELSKNQFIKNTFTKDVLINEEIMRLLGYYLAEGHITNTINQIGFSFNKNETGYISDCTSILEKLTNKTALIRHPNPNSTQILIHSKEWATFFEHICGKSKNKHVPSFIWNSEKKLFLELLKGYLRGDAHKTGEYSLTVKSVVPQLIRELVWLCKLNGISCSLSSEYNKSHKMPQGNIFRGSFVYIITIPKSEIGLEEFDRKRNKFSPFPRERTFPINGLREVYFQIKPKKFLSHRPEQVTLRKKRANLNRIKKVLDWFENYNSLDFNESSLEIMKNYKSLFNSEIGVVKIKNIVKKGTESVYDISVEETESFFGNDYPILLHNSGNKGFHIIVPWKAFPEEISGKKTKDMFPEWPRRICAYLKEKSRPFLEKEMASEDAKFLSKFKRGVRCETCKNISEEKEKILYICPSCKTELENTLDTFKKKRIIRCPKCEKEMLESSRSKFYFCNICNKNSKTHPDNFNESAIVEDIFEVLGLDVILVSPRHLFRMPYSLHEKTALASVVLNSDSVKDFDITRDADPLRIIPKNFIPNSRLGEAKRLLIEAIEYKLPEESQNFRASENNNNSNNKDKKFSDFTIKNLNPSMYPPSIKKILEGMKTDGRKRALFILLSFFKSLKLSDEQISKDIEAWNQKNHEPLPLGYVRGQIMWYAKQREAKLPPNFDKAYYKEIGINPTAEELAAKNPVNYVKRKSFGKIRK